MRCVNWFLRVFKWCVEKKNIVCAEGEVFELFFPLVDQSTWPSKVVIGGWISPQDFQVQVPCGVQSNC